MRTGGTETRISPYTFIARTGTTLLFTYITAATESSELFNTVDTNLLVKNPFYLQY